MLETLPKLLSTRFNSETEKAGSSENLIDMETISRKDLMKLEKGKL
jgi:hypothetical protein